MSRTMYSARDVMMPSNVTPYEMSGMDNSMFIYKYVLYMHTHVTFHYLSCTYVLTAFIVS